MSNASQVDNVVLDILSDVLQEPVDEFRAEPALAAHAWTSLASLEVLAQLENELGIVLDLRAFNAVRTVNALVELACAAVSGASATVAETP
ncbi:MAG TPA: acyl carrier protein [Streptosporangiaceae bacterium]